MREAATSIGAAATPRGREAGFGLVELLVAVVLIALGLIVLAGGAMASMRLDRLANSRADLTYAAESKMEELRAFARTEVADTVQLNAGGSLTTSQANHADTVISGNGRSVVRRWRVQDGPSETRRVTVRTEPEDDRPYQASSVTVETLILLDH